MNDGCATQIDPAGPTGVWPALRVHECFEKLVDRQPAAPAIISDGDTVTYRELDRKANALARALLTHGVMPEEAVGVLTGRSSSLPLAFLAILKAGAAYVPMGADLPPQRLATMAAQSGMRYLIALDGLKPPAELLAALAAMATPAILRPETLNSGGRRPKQRGKTSDLAAILFTSGSTGQPKGVLLQHDACVNMAYGHIGAHQIVPDDRVLLATAPGFILGFRELCLPLLAGAAFVPASRRFGILAFLQRETRALDRKLLVLTVVSGIANAMNLAVINGAVDALKGGGPSWKHFLWFGLSIALFVYSLRYILYESTRISEAAICSVRLRLADKIRRCDLMALESIGEADIHSRISRDTLAIAQAARPLFAAAQGAVMILCTMVYIAIVSPVAMLLCVILIGGGAAKYFRDRAAYDKGLQDASHQEDELFDSLSGLLKGFKELRINKLKSDDVFEEFQSTATRVREVRTRVNILFSNNIIFVEMFFVILLGAVAFVLPVLATSFSGSATKIVAAILFFFGPLSNVVTMIPVLAQVNVTVDNLQRLEGTLDEALVKSARHEAAPLVDLSSFQAIRFEGVSFTYRDPDGNATFQFGPIDGEVRRGEILFLVGGNGRGKTTFLKLFTALYWPAQGDIHVDDLEIGPANIQSYRNLYSAIFSDFHLFDKLHGLNDAAPERVNALLRLMEISNKTAFCDGRFTNTNLSTGQRKRLALVVSYLEDKPVYIFDEVAADQDPSFRRYFYETMLPELKSSGKTVVVVSHDDRYFHVGDRVLQMEYGKLSDVPINDGKAGSRKRPVRRSKTAPQEPAK